jgi:hypothetical protein
MLLTAAGPISITHIVPKCPETVHRRTCRQPVIEENIVKQLNNGHALVVLKMTRLKGFCVECIKKKNDPMYKKNLGKIRTYCPACRSGNWICEPCFDEHHFYNF